ncbi:UrcA family protein [Novosphingobium sp.]|uniref:UrcA family protein n=1 Tax=Novosphingobium sp. TaxID=1874826 RepID=UPI0025F78712|nr:UrcA family protein [Novosphingobium sp.]
MKSSLLALTAIAFATPAMASTTDNPLAESRATLNLKGLDLSTADGQQRLAIRIDQAARAVCGDRLAGVHLSLDSQSQACRTSVAADVRAQIETRVAKASGTPTRLASAR